MPKGLKPVRRKLATGEPRLYWYHRATGLRLKHDPETAEGLLEVRGLDDRAKGVAAVHAAQTGTFAALWTAYRDSPEWRGLKPRTRSDYQAVRDWLGPAADRAVVRAMTPAQILKLRDKAAKERGRRFGNYVLQVVRLTLAWSKPRGWLAAQANPAEGLKLIKKPSAERDQNRAWTFAEVEAFATDCPAQLLVPFSLGLFAGMRQGDALIVTRKAYNGATLRWRAGKNGEACTAPVRGAFKILLDKAVAKAGDAVQIALNSKGDAWTQSGFRASFFKRVRALTMAGLIEPGCTFHGLRHTIGTFARDGGESSFRVAAAIGDRTTAMADIYGRDADRQGAQQAVLSDVQQRFAAIDWKGKI